MRRLIAIFTVSILAASACAQKTTRRNLKPAPAAAVSTVAVPEDTLSGDSAKALILVTGYEKPLRASKETVMVSNRDTSRTITECQLEIRYHDMRGRLLHSRDVSVFPDVPAGETRMVSFPTWDINRLFYYHVNTPRRTGAQATPYTVTITPVRILLRH